MSSYYVRNNNIIEDNGLFSGSSVHSERAHPNSYSLEGGNQSSGVKIPPLKGRMRETSMTNDRNQLRQGSIIDDRQHEDSVNRQL